MARRKKSKPPPRQPRPPRFEKPANAGACPACGEPVVWVRACSVITACHPQRRLVVFDLDRKEDGSPKDHDLALSVIEERRGAVVLGRRATKVEAELFKKMGNPGAPFTIGRESHLALCRRLDRWIAGKARPPRHLAPE